MKPKTTFKTVTLEEIQIGQSYMYNGAQPAINTIVHVTGITDEYIVVDGWDHTGPFEGTIKKQVFIDKLKLVENLDPQYHIKPEYRSA